MLQDWDVSMHFQVSIFDSIYGRNANVFAAVPSLHAAYMVVALVYAIIGKCRWYVVTLFLSSWSVFGGTAVYSCHHYIIDVLWHLLPLIGWLGIRIHIDENPTVKDFRKILYVY